jgi:hypothetical protein
MPIAAPFIDLADAVMADAQAVGGIDMGTTARDALAAYIQGIVSTCNRLGLDDMVRAGRVAPYSIKGRYVRNHIRSNLKIPLPLNLVERYLLRRAGAITADPVAYEALKMAAPGPVAIDYMSGASAAGGGVD